MTIIGRLTKDAVAVPLKEERKVVNFTVAVNDSYKPKGSQTWKTITTYFDCSYWLRTAVVDRLKKGNLVEVSGRVSVSAYKDMQGEVKGSLRFHVDSIKVHQQMKKAETSVAQPVPAAPVAEDLPF
jgi:single-strand DNA-binding protein